jgi:dipeptidyl aminopeptidase/acylaminoacyl peptidase
MVERPRGLSLLLEPPQPVGVCREGGRQHLDGNLARELRVANFASRVRAPVLMINGWYDRFFPVESSRLPLFRQLGAPEKDKRPVIYDTGHAVRRKEFIRESLDWQDKYLAPVKK